MADCCAALAEIARHCGPNAKGIKRNVYLACIDDIQTIPDPTADTVKVETDIVMEATKVFTVFNIGKTNQAFEADAAGDGDGATLDYRIQFFIPRMDGDKASILNGTMNGEYIFIFEDKNGVQHIIGAKDDGALLKVKSQTDPNGYLISVEWDSSHIAYVYTGLITT